MGASAPHRGTVFRWRIHECKSGRSQCWCTGSLASASKAANQCRSCHDFASERSQMVTACQCSDMLALYVDGEECGCERGVADIGMICTAVDWTFHIYGKRGRIHHERRIERDCSTRKCPNTTLNPSMGMSWQCGRY